VAEQLLHKAMHLHLRRFGLPLPGVCAAPLPTYLLHTHLHTSTGQPRLGSSPTTQRVLRRNASNVRHSRDGQRKSHRSHRPGPASRPVHGSCPTQWQDSSLSGGTVPYKRREVIVFDTLTSREDIALSLP
jgi:hypothetical protein